MKIYISMPVGPITDTFITPRSLLALEEVGEVKRNLKDRILTEDEMVEEAFDADVIFCGWGTIKFTDDLVKRLPNLKVLAYVAGSMANVLEETLDKRVTPLTGNHIFAQSVAEGALAYILCSLRELEKNIALVREGGWKGLEFYNRGIFGKKIGLVGFGSIAKNMVKLLKPFDVEILVNSGYLTEEDAEKWGVKETSKEEIFSTCDIISIHLAKNDKTYKIINRDLLSMIKKDALLVNTARGAVIDEEAMIELLQEGRFNAALDVFEKEPLDLDSPLRTLKNVMPIPHMGGPTIDVREHIVLSFAKDLKAYTEGKEMNNLFDLSTLKYMTVGG